MTGTPDSPVVRARAAAAARFCARHPVAMSCAAALLAILAGALHDRTCLTAQPWTHGAAVRSCDADLWYLYPLRGLAGHAFPYLHAQPQFGLPKGTVEYPVLTALFAWLTAQPAHDSSGYFLVSTIALGTVALLTAAALGRLTGRRALLFAATPAVALYTAQNWDILAVAAVVAGTWAWAKGRPGWAAVCFAAGTCLKLYPALLLLALAADCGFNHGRRRATRVLAVGGAAVVAVNLPFMLISWSAWWQVLQYQQLRGVDISAMSLWSVLIPGQPVTIVNAVSLLALAAGVVLVLYAASQRASATGAYPFLPACAALVTVFILASKVESPQYLLWIAPYFALLRVRWPWWVAYAATDLVGYFLIMQLTLHTDLQLATGSPLLVAVILARWLLLLTLTARFLRAQPGLTVDREPVGGLLPTAVSDRAAAATA
jgi:uncharacterized membrane protein